MEEGQRAEKAKTDYREFLTKQLQLLNCTYLPYPQVSHEQVVERAVTRRKPFNKSGAGYRDTLIWFSVLELLKANRSVVYLVTSNTRDFGDGPRVALDLLADIDAIGVPQDMICVMSSLANLNEELILPQLEHLKGLAKAFAEEADPLFSVREWIDSFLVAEIENSDWQHAVVDLEPDHGSVHLKSLNSIDSFDVEDVWRLPSGDMVLSVSASGSVAVSVNADFDDVLRYPDLRDFFDYDGGESFISAWAEFDQALSVEFTLVLENITHKLTTVEITAVNNYG